MSEKRYQIFISSTFTDLSEERRAIMDAVLNLDCFPSGMEMFPASDMEQFEYIKRVIEESDYYILVVAGKYGSISNTGISYTEMEYDYAKEKGIPILTFIKKDIKLLTGDKIELEPSKIEKIKQFRKKISKDKLVKYWNNSDELKYNVYDSLSKAIKMYKRPGWVKGDVLTDTTLLRQINNLRTENEKLKEDIAKTNENRKRDSNKLKKVENNIKNLSQGDDEYEIYYNLIYYNNNGDECEVSQSIRITWNDLFYGLGYKIMEAKKDILAGGSITTLLETVILDKVLERNSKELNIPDIYKEETEIYVDSKNITVILLQLTHLNLIYEDGGGKTQLTKRGRDIIIDRLLVKRHNKDSKKSL